MIPICARCFREGKTSVEYLDMDWCMYVVRDTGVVGIVRRPNSDVGWTGGVRRGCHHAGIFT